MGYFDGMSTGAINRIINGELWENTAKQMMNHIREMEQHKEYNEESIKQIDRIFKECERDQR